MDLIDGMRTFAAVVEAGSFTAAGDRLGMSKKLASKYVAELESRLRVQLLRRTTRSLSLTNAGSRYYPRCVAVLEEIDALGAEIREGETGLSGLLRVSAPVTFGELFLQDALADFREDNPDLVIDLRLNDRFVDLAGEGFDLAIRIGVLEDSTLVARKLGETEIVAVASLDYLARAGMPESPADLSRHACLRDSNFRAGQAWAFEIGGTMQRIPVTGGYLVNSATAVRRLALRGAGIALCPDYAVAQDIAAGRLRRVLADFPSPTLGINAVFPDARRLPARTRAALDHLSRTFADPPWRAGRG
ncbi:LysR family transcriptional regulator [Rhodobacterales bacterium HKCCE3408]|nr:LysR family transcriptional regulator [Rhodobacterales bacterium HKCCE3408]